MTLVAFHQKIKEYYEGIGVRQKNLAEALNLSPVSLSYKLNGNRPLKAYDVHQIIKTLVSWKVIAKQDQVIELLEYVDLGSSSYNGEEWFQKLEIKTKPTNINATILPQKITPNNLPAQITSLIGRKKEKDEIIRILNHPEVRLLTLTGVGGIGKTRLSLVVGTELLKEFDDGIFFVDLSSAQTTEAVLWVLTQALELKLSGRQSLIDILKEYIKAKKILLILDNFEQVLPARSIITKLLHMCPGLKILATSREILDIYGEHLYEVPALGFPSNTDGYKPEEILQIESIKLFNQRAQAAKFNFEITKENISAVADICARLEGLPLAIELAAVQIRFTPPQVLLTHLSSRLETLTSGPNNLPLRQQTLRNLLKWSFDLLTTNEKKMFTHLAVFVNSYGLEAVNYVCFQKGELSPNTSKLLNSLVNKSLLRLVSGINGENRFAMLETIREFALEQLIKSGECTQVREYHAEYYRKFAITSEPELRGPEQQVWITRLEQEHENIRVALDWLFNKGQLEKALQMCNALGWFWYIRGYSGEGRYWFELGINQFDTQNSAVSTMFVLAKAYLAFARLVQFQGDQELSLCWLEKSLALHRELNDETGIADCLNALGNIASFGGDYSAAKNYYSEGLELRRRSGNKRSIADSLNNLAIIFNIQGEYFQAMRAYKESLEYRRELRDTQGVGDSLHNLATLADFQGDFDRAIQLYQEALIIRRELGHKRGLVDTLENLAHLQSHLQNHVIATELINESLKIAAEIGSKFNIANAKQMLGEIASAKGNYLEAEEHFRKVLAIDGIEEHYSYILPDFLEGVGDLALKTQNYMKAATLYGAAQEIRETTGGVRMSWVAAIFEENLKEVQSQLEPIIFEHCWESGKKLTYDVAVSLALNKFDNSGFSNEKLKVS